MDQQPFLKTFIILSFFYVPIGILAEENNETTISRNHMGVWFDYSVRYYEHEADNAYTKDDLAVMVNVVSKRFGRIAIDNAPELDKLPPEPSVHSRVLVPSVVANHNKDDPSTAMDVIVTFGAAKILKTDQLSSFDVGKYMADTANDIYPGTVKTLMMFSGFSIFSLFYTNVKETVQQLKLAREKINNSTYGATRHDYELAIFLDIKDCGHFKGSLGNKMKDVLPHIEKVAFLIRPNFHHMTTTPPEIMHKMFVTKFEECEKKIKEERASIKVLPVVLWMSTRKNSSKGFVQFWQLISNWAKKNNKEVIMYEAFDTPHGRLISDQGWFRLKDKSEHIISTSIFVEKTEDAQTSSSKLDSPRSIEESSDEEGESQTFYPTSSALGSESRSRNVQSSNNNANTAQPLYIAVVLLCVICILLVAVIVGLVWGFHSTVVRQNHYQSFFNHENSNGTTNAQKQSRRSNNHLQHSSIEEDNPSSSSGVLEIRDTTPIVAVTYRK